MANALSIKKRLDNVLKKYAPIGATVYKRFVTRSGGDDLIGSPASVVYTDTLLTPQPMYFRNGRLAVGGTDAELDDTAIGNRVSQDYEMIVAFDAMSLAELQNRDVIFKFVANDGSGDIQIYRLQDFEAIGFQGTTIGWDCYITSTV